MRRGLVLLAMVLAGCSTHPLADTLDFFEAGKLYPDGKTNPYGGVCCNQGPIVGPGAGGPPQINVGPPSPVMPTDGVVPPPVPVMGGAGPAPGPAVPPPPPPPGF